MSAARKTDDAGARSVSTPNRSRRSDARKEDIVEAARTLYSEKGLEKTSIQDITDSLGVARSLFYHYFPNKKAVTLAVLDSLVDDYIEALSLWNEERVEGEIDDALISIVRVVRLCVFENEAFHKTLTVDTSAGLYLEFISRVADHTAEYIIQTTAQDYAKLHNIRIQHLYETLYVLIIGVIGYLRMHPDMDDRVIADIIAQTLYLDKTKG